MDLNSMPREYERNTYMRSAALPPCKAVWVALDRLWPPPAQRRVVIDGLDFHGHARGLIFRWLRTGEGLWLGVVTYEVGFVDGRRHRVLFRDQLIPAWALSERHDHVPLTGSSSDTFKNRPTGS